MDETLLVERRGHTTIFTLNRPAKRNAYNDELVNAIEEAMRAFDQDPDQYVGIITGAGEAAFCSGADMSGGRVRNAYRGPLDHLEMFGVGNVRKPMIAAVNGLAVGGGTELALNCDIRIAAESAWFGLLEPKRGMLAGVAVHLLPRLISYGDAAWMLLTADRVSAAEAHRMGLVQKVVPDDQLLDECLAVAETIGGLSQLAVQGTKAVMSLQYKAMWRESMVVYREVMARLNLSDDHQEGLTAFAEKRDPDFSNRWPGQD
jgi:enoyl-CoA hydratase/carnithine racemase